jgi:hypothetical protein
MAPQWARTRRELFYLDDSNSLVAVSVQTSGPQFTLGTAVRVFDGKYAGNLILVRCDA